MCRMCFNYILNRGRNGIILKTKKNEKQKTENKLKSSESIYSVAISIVDVIISFPMKAYAHMNFRT